MKKVIIGIFIIVIIMISAFFMWYNQNLQKVKEISKFNEGFKEFLNKDINVVELSSAINLAIENNNNLEIPKNKDGSYKNNNENSIEILIKLAQERKYL